MSTGPLPGASFSLPLAVARVIPAVAVQHGPAECGRQATGGPLPPLRHSLPPPGLSASPPPVHLRPPALHGSKADGSSAPPPTVRHCLRRRSGLHLCRTPPPSALQVTCGRPISTRQLRQHHNMWHLRSLEMMKKKDVSLFELWGQIFKGKESNFYIHTNSFYCTFVVVVFTRIPRSKFLAPPLLITCS